MKGKTIIELKDVNSGKVQKVEHHNVFQSAVLENLFKLMGALGISMINTEADQWKSLVGGILVFDNTITEGTQYVPADVNMTANGAYNVLNTGDPVELGSWNESESYNTADEIVMVYDYTTSQGNGEIASVCLTHYNAGYGGVGNASQTETSSLISPFLMERTVSIADYVLTDGSYFYWYSKSGNTLTVNRRWGNMAGVDILRGWNIGDYDESYTITLPSDFASGITYESQLTETKIAYFKAGESTFSAIVVDLKTRAVSNVYTIPLLGTRFGGAVGGSDTLLMWQYHTDQNGEYLSIYDAVAGQWIEEVELHSRGGHSMDVQYVWKVGGRYYFRVRDWSSATTARTTTQMHCIKDGVAIPTNATVGQQLVTYSPTLDIIHRSTGDYYDRKRTFSRFPYYLATINNLEEPIVKDNTKTMKITYVLTRR